MKTVVIVGGGPAGLALAVKLGRSKSFNITVIEKRPKATELVRDSLDPGTYAVGLWSSTMSFLKEIGSPIPEECGVYLKHDGFAMETKGKPMKKFPWKSSSNSYFMTCRETIRTTLIDTILSDPELSKYIQVHFDARLLGFKDETPESNSIIVQVGESEKVFSYDFLVGADGVFSKVRRSLDNYLESKKELPITKSITPCPFSLRFLNVPESSIDKLSHIVSMDASSGFLSTTKSKIALFFPVGARPGGKRRYMNAILLAFGGPKAVDELNSWSDYDTLFSEFQKEFPSLDPKLLVEEKEHFEDFASIPAVPNGHWVKLNRYHHENIVLIGDAAHGMFPNLGAGMNTSVQDAKILGKLLLDSVAGERVIDFSEFTFSRKPDAESIQEISGEFDGSNPLYFLWNDLLRMVETNVLHPILPSFFAALPVHQQLAFDLKSGRKVKQARDATASVIKGTLVCFATAIAYTALSYALS